MTATYFLCKLKNVPQELEDDVSELCFSCGASGVSETLDFIQTNEYYDPEIIKKSFLQLDVYFYEPPDSEFIAALKRDYPDIIVELSEEPQKDWLEEWKKGFEAFVLVDNIWVVPSWLEAPNKAASVIWMDPGMAFGTGTHETTQLASRLLGRSLQKEQAQSLLDVGTGTGILSILACQLGVKKIVSTEIDPIARGVARENINKNKCKGVQVLDIQIEEVSEDFDFVVANIIDGVLLQIGPSLRARVRSKGRLLLTGILNERASAFISEFNSDSRFNVSECHQQGEWTAYLLEKRP